MGKTATYNDMLVLTGPTGIGWIVNPDFSISASRLTIPHARVAFQHYYEKRDISYNAHYAKRLGMRLREQNERECRDEFVALCKQIRNKNVCGVPLNTPVVQAHCEALAYLGHLAKQAMRTIENGIICKGFVKDLRTLDPFEFETLLDKWGIPTCNLPNPYEDLAILPSMHQAIQGQWLRQDDQQAADITKQLIEGSIY